MKKVFVFLICVLSPFFVFANPMEKEQETYINYFSYIKLNPDNSIDAGPIFFGRLSYDNFPEVKEQHLKPGNEFSMGDGHHAFTTIKYIGPKDGRVIFEETHTFDAISFGGGVSKETKIKSVKPYTFSEFSKGRELKVFDELLTYFDDYFPLYKNNMDKLSEILGPNPMFDDKFPLLLRVSHEKSAIEYLLSKGSDINVKSESKNIIHMVIMNPFGPDIETRLDLIRFFIEKGADINEKDNNGKTVLNRVDERIEELQSLIQNQKAADYLERELEQKTIFREMLIGKDNCEGYYDDKTKRCYTCESEKTPKEVADTLCKMCPEREMRREKCQSTQKTKECQNRDGDWYMEYDWETGEERECKKCPDSTEYFETDYNGCLQCPDRIPGEPDDHNYAQCYSCEKDMKEITKWADSFYLRTHCSGWFLDKHTNHYRPDKCKKENHVVGSTIEEGYALECLDCQSSEIIRTNEEECSKCPNRTFIYGDPYHFYHITYNEEGKKVYHSHGVGIQRKEEMIDLQDIIQEGLCVPTTLIGKKSFKVQKNADYSGKIDDTYNFETIDDKNYLKDALFIIDGNVNTQNPLTGNTLLMDILVGAEKDKWYLDFDEIESLLKKGIDISIQNKEGKTIVSLALEKGYHRLLDLIKDQIDINMKDENGETFLHHVIRNDYSLGANLFDLNYVLDSNPDVNIVNKNGENIFQFFVRMVKEQPGIYNGEKAERFSAIAKFLIHAHAPDSGYAICEMLNQKSAMGMEIAEKMNLAGADLTNILICPGIWETDWIYPEKMAELVRFGANVNAVDKETGMTPLKYAIKTDAGRIVINFLKQQGAKE